MAKFSTAIAAGCLLVLIASAFVANATTYPPIALMHGIVSVYVNEVCNFNVLIAHALRVKPVAVFHFDCIDLNTLLVRPITFSFSHQRFLKLLTWTL